MALTGSCLTGMVFCADRSRPLYRQGTGTGSDQNRTVHLMCSGVAPKLCPGIGCPQVSALEDALRTFALTIAADLADNSPKYLQRQSKATRSKTEVKRLTAEKDALNAIGRLGASLGKGVMDDQGYEEAVKAAPGRACHGQRTA